jgi:hypothetical protein
LEFFSPDKALRAGVGSRGVRDLALKASRVATGSHTRHEVRTVFRRREAEGVLRSGESASLYEELTADIAATDVVIQPEMPDTERGFWRGAGGVLSNILFGSFLRNVMIHLAQAGDFPIEGEFFRDGKSSVRGFGVDLARTRQHKGVI